MVPIEKTLMNHDILHVLCTQLLAKYRIMVHVGQQNEKKIFSNKIFNNHESG